MLTLPSETERPARLVAAKSGKTPEDVVQEAIERQALMLGVVPDRSVRPVDMKKIDAIRRRSAGRPLRDQRGAKEILDDAWGDLA